MKKFILFVFSFLILQNLALAQEQNLDQLYVGRLKKNIENNWIMPLNSDEKSTVIAFSVVKDGKIKNIKIIRSSGDEHFDTSALMSIYKSVPFDNLPENYSADSADFEFFFSPLFNSITRISTSKNIGNKLAPVPNNIKVTNVTDTDKISLREASNINNIVSTNAIKKTKEDEQQNIKSVNFTPYMKDLQKKIKYNWQPPHMSESKRVVTRFNIQKDGTLAEPKIYHSSGDQICDERAIAAITKSAPFTHLPDDFKGKSITVQFTFDYNVWGLKKNGTDEVFCNNFNGTSDYQNYLKQVNLIIDNSLPRNTFYLNKKLYLVIDIDKVGKINTLKVESSSGDKNFDNKVITNIQKCTFPPIPDSLGTENFTTDYLIKTERQNNTAPIDNLGSFCSGLILGLLIHH